MKANKQNTSRVTATFPSRHFKQVIQVLGEKTVIEPSAPRRYRMTAFLAEFGQMPVSIDTDFIPQGIAELKKEIIRLRREVPPRIEVFKRIDALVNAKFSSRYAGCMFLNSIEPEWRSAPTARLEELVKVLEGYAD